MRRTALAPTRAQTRPVLAAIAGLFIALAAPPWGSAGHAETMSSALARAYAGNPDLNQQRAGVRATDENLPRATSRWRPTANATGQFGYNYFDLTAPRASGSAALGAASGAPIASGASRLRQAADPGSLGLTVTQNLFNGNRTVNGVRQAELGIFGARETLRNTEQNVLLDGATAYMNVLRDTAILDLRKNNIIVLEEQLRQTRDRFIVGEVTRTDVAQAEFKPCYGTLRLLYRASQSANQCRPLPPGDRRRADQDSNRHARSRACCHARSAPRLSLRSSSIQASRRRCMRWMRQPCRSSWSRANSIRPSISSAMFNKIITFPAWRENVSSMGRSSRRSRCRSIKGARSMRACAKPRKPLGQARLQADLQRDLVRAEVVSAWGQLDSARAVIQSSKAAVKSAEIALDGIRQEAEVGQRTTFDILFSSKPC